MTNPIIKLASSSANSVGQASPSSASPSKLTPENLTTTIPPSAKVFAFSSPREPAQQTLLAQIIAEPNPASAQRMTKKDSSSLHHTRIITTQGNTFELLNTLSHQEATELFERHRIRISTSKVKLGKGHFGTVRLARDIVTNEIVAVKKLLKITDAEREIAQLQDSGSNNSRIINFLDFAHIKDEHVEKSYIFIELFGNRNGLQAIKDLATSKNKNHYKQHFAGNYIAAVADLHKKGLYHRDIKPENFLHAGESIKLADLGVATNRVESQGAKDFGSPFYCPPEAIKYGQRARFYNAINHDAFSLGITLLFLKLEQHPNTYAGPHLELPSFYRDQPPIKITLEFYGEPKIYCEGVKSSNRHIFISTLKGNTLDEVIAKLLAQDTDDRATPAEALSFPYVQAVLQK